MNLRSSIILALFIMVIIILATDAHYHHYQVPHYHFQYGVHDPHTKDHKHHEEHRDHDEVKGSYTIDDPDGTKRIVEYTAGKHTGFRAIVRREGHAHHPDGHHAHYGGDGESFHGETHWGFGFGR